MPDDTQPPDPDADLVARARNGDTRAFDALILKYGEKLYGLVYNMTSHKEDTHDLLQDIFAKAYHSLPRFRGQGSGTIINTTSVAARHGGGPGALVYAAAKAAVSSLTRGLAKELAPHRIRVNAISPGVVLTPIHERLSSPAVMEAFIRQVPLGRAAAADECVGAFLFLASERLSSYVTGQVLEVNGGQFMP